MKGLLAALATLLSVSAAHAATYVFNDTNALSGGSGIGEVVVTLGDSATSGDVDFSIDTTGMTAGLNIRAVFFTFDFDVNAGGGLGVPLLPGSSDPSGSFFDYTSSEAGFNPVGGISADSRLRFGTESGGVFSGGLDSTETFAGTLQRLDIPLTVLNFTQVAIQIQDKGYFAGPVAPVPVPSSLPLLAGGVVLAGFVLNRRKRRA